MVHFLLLNLRSFLAFHKYQREVKISYSEKILVVGWFQLFPIHHLGLELKDVF
jgi:hypothetical protein